MSLRRRIAISLALVALVVGAGIALTAYFSTVSDLHAADDQSLQAILTSAGGDQDHGARGGGSADGNDQTGAPGLCPDTHSLQSASAAQLISASGAVTACVSEGPALPAFRSSNRGVEFRTVTVAGNEYRVAISSWNGNQTLEVARSLAETDSVLDGLRLRLLFEILVATAAAAALGALIATQLSRPIVRLRNAAHRIATTLDTSTPVSLDGPGEVGSLATSFSTMVAAFDQSREQQRRLVADASHEMRTPLTSLRSNVELLAQIERLPREERADVVRDVLEDVDELSALLEEVVELASDLTTSEATEEVDLDELSREVAARMQRRTAREITVTGSQPIPVAGRPRQLERAIQNLIDNAVKYSPAGGAVEVDVSGTTVSVRDRGPGIAHSDLSRVFDRFFRSVANRTLPGSGLGLSIVYEVVRGHGGHVFARNRDTGGAEVGFSLPSEPATP